MQSTRTLPPVHNAKPTLDPGTRRGFILTGLTLFGLLVGWIFQDLKWLSVAGYTLAFLTGGIPAAKEALTELIHERKLDVDLLMVLAALGAASIGEARDGAILLFLFSLSNTLQDWAMGRTKRAIEALMDLNPDGATVRRGGAVSWMKLEDIQPGDVLIIKPGERIAADARLIAGQTSVDESPITGESLPIDKQHGSPLFSGTVNLNGSIEAEVIKPAGESTLAKLIELVEKAEHEKSPTETLAEKWESPYATVVLISVPVVFAVLHYMFGLSVGDAWYRAMTFMVVASPCAVVISTPAVMLSAMAASARAGVLFKSSAALEVLGRVKTIALDKTGTLTHGKMRLTDAQHLSGNEEDNWKGIYALETHSEHPVAVAVVHHVQEMKISSALKLENIEAVPGYGIQGKQGNKTFWAGTRKMAERMGVTLSPDQEARLTGWENQGKSTIIYGTDQQVQVILGIADTLRDDARAMVHELTKLGVNTVMLTGDRKGVAQEIARQVGLTDYRAELLPEHKLDVIKSLPAPNAHVGDGVNDAPALNAASIGISLASGTDIAMESADVVLMNGDLTRLSSAVRLARKANQTVIFNLTFAFAIIVVVGILSIFGKVPLPLGVVAHEGGTVFVVFMGLRLLGERLKTH
ncbi:heavy metal translocating P-type ATPase [Deinococcus cellulosilyticus]|uniref:Cation-transporting ATPase n=1 Tax=Deinococcus cellulosilyticus (strain DSM 18568 / NBRC 106333 / KACC 11606 / 5516J-15) TaxID=1223518 RepID=A0A511MX58_DEIC1|nr:heavy metal translocating P-type ATPase [Deinococcus cellulosilyticus]GEM44848.1 cation-transporting ATPase [Deinococcus cellulosilyticus NBRC 106333 = KACC 11606]